MERTIDNGRRLLQFYVASVVLGALAAVVLSAQQAGWSSSNEFVNALLAMLALALVTELSSVRVNVGTVTMSMSFLPSLASVFLFDQVWAMLIGGMTFFIV